MVWQIILYRSENMKQIYIHGLGQTSTSWDKTISRSVNREHVLCPDLADLVQAGGVDYASLYAAFSELCNQIAEPVDLCGLSLGSVLALNYAIDYPDRVRSLALIAPQYKMPKGLLRFQNILFRLMPVSAFKATGFKKADFIRLCRSMAELDFSGSIAKISCPVLVIYGEKDGANKKAAIGLHRALKNGTLKEIHCAGHEVNIDAPEALTELLCAFYDCIPTGS